MKKILFSFLFGMNSILAFCQAPVSVQGELLWLTVQTIDNPIVGGLPIPKSPIQPPTVSINGHTLYLYNIGYSFTLALRDENDNYVYVTNVPAGSTSVVLPSDLSGDYTLVLYPGGDYYFEGEITL